jgi:hypothetical protein
VTPCCITGPFCPAKRRLTSSLPRLSFRNCQKIIVGAAVIADMELHPETRPGMMQIYIALGKAAKQARIDHHTLTWPLIQKPQKRGSP